MGRYASSHDLTGVPHQLTSPEDSLLGVGSTSVVVGN